MMLDFLVRCMQKLIARFTHLLHGWFILYTKNESILYVVKSRLQIYVWSYEWVLLTTAGTFDWVADIDLSNII